MKSDKIIRAVSDIDERYILEAAPDQPAMANRRRFLMGRVIGITAIAAAAVIGLVIGGIAVLGPSRGTKTAMDAAKEEIVSQAGKGSYTSADEAITARNETEAVYEDEFEAVQDIAEEEKAAESWEGPALTFSSLGPNGEKLIFVYAAASDTKITEIAAKFTLLSGNSSGALYLVEPDEEAGKDGDEAVLGQLRLNVNSELAPREIEVMSGDFDSSEMPGEMQQLYDEAMKK